jgi:hypothetical protein
MNDNKSPEAEILKAAETNNDIVGPAKAGDKTELDDVNTNTPEPPENKQEVPNDEGSSPWDIAKAEKEVLASFANDSETDLLKVLKDNSFLFYDLYDRKYGIQPVFRELNFGAVFRCDFAWLNDKSSGPEWVLVELEKPKMPLFNADGKPTAKLQGALEQVKTWDQYFEENKGEAKRIFGAVAEFRFILVAGSGEHWGTEHAQKWRIYNHKRFHIEIRSMDTFLRAIKIAKEHPAELWSFKEKPVTLPHTRLESYWREYDYMDRWRQVID